jgi:hypothetical protein
MRSTRSGAVRRVLRRAAVIALTAAILYVTVPGTLRAPEVRAALNPGTVGVTAITLRDDPVRGRQLDAMRAEGFPAVRLIIEWPLIEPSPGRFDWAETDAIVMDAATRNLTILGLVTYAPAWAATEEGRQYLHPAPADPQVFADFVKTAAERYRGVIRNWEIWNEPNVVQSFAPRPDVALYSAMLEKAYSAIKSVDPYSVVISGGTSPAVDQEGSLSPATFIHGLLSSGAGDSLDAVGMHPYSSPSLLSEQTQWYSSNAAINNVTYLMNYLGQSHKRIWFTEFGASTARVAAQPGTDPSSQHVGVSESRQAEILVDGINYLRSLPNGGPIFLFDHRDIETGSNTVEFSYGLLRSDFSPKPALAAVQRLLAPA